MAGRKKKLELIPSVITSEFTVHGDFIGEGAAEIACQINGDVRCLSLVVKTGAIINGDIAAEKAEIYGEVNGNVTAKNVICGSSAKIVGDITHQKIQIENGAYIDGSCRKFISEEAN